MGVAIMGAAILPETTVQCSIWYKQLVAKNACTGELGATLVDFSK